MSEHQNRHCDCQNYAPVDVVKGICHRTKNLIFGDETHCEHFAALAKCRICVHYSASPDEHLGICNADPDKPWTYPDLIATTCPMFEITKATERRLPDGRDGTPI